MPWLVIAAGLLAYCNSFSGPFIFDDPYSILENPTIRHLWPIWQPLSPPHDNGITVAGRPLVNYSLAVNYALGGTEVQGYHIVNLIIHVLAGLTLLGVVRRTLLQPKMRERFGAAANELALAAAVLWTVHPLQTESVTYVVQRAESIMGLFYLLTLYCLIRAAESPLPRWWYTLCVTACALGMASKEVMASAPLMVLLYDRTFVSGSFREAWQQRSKLYLKLAGTWLLLGYLVFFTGSFNNAVINARMRGIGRWTYLLTEPAVMLHYLRLSVWPHPLCFDYYGWPLAGSWPGILLPALVIAILLGIIVWACKKNSAWGFLGAWFFLILAPSSSFMPTDSPAYEHRMYLSLAAVVVAAVIGIYALAGRRTVMITLALAIGLGVLTWRRNQDYRTELAIWSDAAANRPMNPRAHTYLGKALLDAGNVPDAIGQLDEAIRLTPDYAEPHYYLGNAFLASGKMADAVGQWEQAVRFKPDHAEARNNLAAALAQAGKLPEAIEQFKEVVRITPDDAEAHYNLALALQQTGRIEDAIAQYKQALQIRPDYPDAQNNLLQLLAKQPGGIAH